MKAKKLKKELRSMVELKEFLKNPSPKVKVPLYTEIEVIQTTTNFGDDTVKKPTLSQRLDELTEIVKDGFKRVNTRIDNLEKDVNSFKQEVNNRFDRIDARIDYIVKINNLKDNQR